jgi:hypothetical protein
MTGTTQAVEAIIKTDGLGRIKTPPERRRTLLEEFERSGLSGKKFAALAGIKYQTFASWLQKRRGQGKSQAKPADTVRWLEAVVEKAQTSGVRSPVALVVELPGGARMEISDATQAGLAASLLRSLAQPC